MNRTRGNGPPKYREVVVEINENGKQNKKRGSKNSLAPAVARAPGGTVGGQSYVKFKGLGSVLGGFNGTDLVVERTEALYTFVSASTANTFKCETLTQFPGYSGLNWLKTVSDTYGEYEVHRVEYTYVPSVPTTVPGTIAMSFYADTRDTAPTSMVQVLSSEQSLMAPVYAGGDGGTYLQRFGAPSGNVVSFEVPQHVIRLASGVYKRYKMTTDTGMSAIIGTAGGAVANMYAFGELNVASDGVNAASQPLGTLFIRYKIRLIGPVPPSNNS